MIADLTRLIERATRLAYPMRVSPELHASRIIANREKKGAGADRLTAMRALWDEGKTLAEIGDQYGITRERVRQLFKRAYGETPMSMRYIETAYKKVKNKHQYREQCALNYYGVSYDVVCSFGDPKQKGSIPYAFRSQKNNAKHRGIAWDLSLVEWTDIWKRSGHLSERGQGKGRYVMSRIADQGGYSVGNVVIQTHSENSTEARAMDRARGTVPLYEYNGEKFTLTELSAKCGLAPNTIRHRLKRWPVEKAVNTPKSNVGRGAVKQ